MPTRTAPKKKTLTKGKTATTKRAEVAAYLAALPPDRRAEIARVRDVFLKNLPTGYSESLAWGMITYCVPLSRHPDTQNGQPLCYGGIASRKNYNTLHLMSVYGSPVYKKRLEAGFKAEKKKLDMGKACIRFKSSNELPLGVIGEIVAAVPVEKWIAMAEAARGKKKN